MAQPSTSISERISPIEAALTPTRTATITASVTLAYMVVAFCGLVAVVGPGSRGLPLVAAHAAIAGALGAALGSHGALARFARAWLPLAAIPVLYAELPYLIALVGAEYGDPVVQHWERLMWGGQPARALASRLPALWISEALHLAYLSYYGMIYLPLAWLWACATRAEGRDRSASCGQAFEEASLAVVATFAICFAVFVVFPVQGPRYLWPAPSGIPEGPVRRLVLAILEQGSSRGAAFPSSHMAVAVVQAMMAVKWRIPGRAVIVLATIGVGVGAVYGGFHYAVDMLAGAALGAAVFLVVGRSKRS